MTASAGSLSRSHATISPRLTAPGTLVGFSVQARNSSCATCVSSRQRMSFGGCRPSSAAANAVGAALIARSAGRRGRARSTSGMHVHECLLRRRNVEQRVALRRHLAEPAADQEHQIGALDARQQLWDWGRCRDRRHSRDGRGRTGARGGTSSQPAARNARRSAATRAQAASDQRLPPSSTIGRSAAQSIFCSRLMSVRPGQVSTGSNGRRIRRPRRARSACPRAAR